MNRSGDRYLRQLSPAAFPGLPVPRPGMVATSPTTLDEDRLDNPVPGLRFVPVPEADTEVVTAPHGYRCESVIRWGDPVVSGAPAFDAANQCAAHQAWQFGYNCGSVALLGLPGEWDRKVMVASHRSTDEVLMFDGYDVTAPTREQVSIGWAAHGLSVVVLGHDADTDRLSPVPGHRLNRRITATTSVAFTGPAAHSTLLATSAAPWGRRAMPVAARLRGARCSPASGMSRATSAMPIR